MAASPPSYCTGVSVEPDMRYSIYASIFMNWLPNDFDQYSAIPDH